MFVKHYNSNFINKYFDKRRLWRKLNVTTTDRWLLVSRRRAKLTRLYCICMHVSFDDKDGVVETRADFFFIASLFYLILSWFNLYSINFQSSLHVRSRSRAPHKKVQSFSHKALISLQNTNNKQLNLVVLLSHLLENSVYRYFTQCWAKNPISARLLTAKTLLLDVFFILSPLCRN